MEHRIRKGWNHTRNAINSFIKQTDRSNTLQQWPEVVFSDNGDMLCVELSMPIALKSWPYRASSSRKKCHILIDGKFSCREGENGRIELLSYGTRVGYFEPKSSSEPHLVNPIGGYHFDMEIDIQRAHPVFHAQRDDRVLVDRLSDFGLELLNDPPDSPLRHVRLPTPQIDLLSVLIFLIADHIVCDSGSEQGFFTLVRKARNHIPLKANLSHQAHLLQCVEQQELLLDHWYAQAAQ